MQKENLTWVMDYYNNDLTLDINAFYSETFKFVSNIIQYKIPFYLSFFVSILKLFIFYFLVFPHLIYYIHSLLFLFSRSIIILILCFKNGQAI